MELRKLAGRGSAARKYDLLTILGSYALSQDKGLQRLVLRMICLITARYNWQSDQLSIAQTEIAKLWSCDPRTVKREMALLRQKGWLVERIPAARGRATVYGLGMERILEDTRGVWENVGPDLVSRLSPAPEPAEAERKVIPFPQSQGPSLDGSLWSMVAQRLYNDDPVVFQTWFAGLSAELGEGELALQTPGSFHKSYIETHLRPRIERHLQQMAPGLRLFVR